MQEELKLALERLLKSYELNNERKPICRLDFENLPVVIAARAALAKSGEGCEWYQDNAGNWKAHLGLIILPRHPRANGWTYCPHCGKPIKEVSHAKAESVDDDCHCGSGLKHKYCCKSMDDIKKRAANAKA